MKPITLEMLMVMTPPARASLYENARKKRGEGGQAVMDLLDQSGLSMRSGGMTLSDPVYLEMEEIIWSVEGRRAAVAATENGLPALAGVEPLLTAALRFRYQPHDMGTVSAGSLVGELMRHLGYVKGKAATMPSGSIAKTAATWRAKKQ